jgi:hypothetical protein
MNRYDFSNMYAVHVETNTTNSYARLQKVYSGGGTNIISGAITAPGTNTFRIKYRRRGTTHYLYYNDTLIGSVVDNQVLLLDSIDNQPGFSLLGLYSYFGGAATLRVNNFTFWDEGDYAHVQVGSGNSARIVSESGAVLVGPTSADANGWANLDISATAYPLSGRVQKLVGGSVYDEGPLYFRTVGLGIVPGMRWLSDPNIPWRRTTVLGQASLDITGYVKVLNPCVVYNPGDSLYHLYCEGRTTADASLDVLHYTNPAFAITGWTKQATIFTGNYGDPDVFWDGTQWVMVVQRYTPDIGIYVYTSPNGNNPWTLQSTVVPKDTAGSAEGSNLWGATIIKKLGRYYVQYEAERDPEFTGVSRTRRISTSWSDSLAGPWSYGHCRFDHYDAGIIHGRYNRPCGYSAPCYFEWEGRLYVVLDSTYGGGWSPYLARSLDGITYEAVSSPMPFGLGLAKGNSTPRDHVFSCTIKAGPGNVLLGCFHSGDITAQGDGIFLWTGDMIASPSGGGSGGVWGTIR